MGDGLSNGLQTGVIERGSDDAKGRVIKGYTTGVDAEARTADGIASTINIDRDDEIILPSAFKKGLKKFLGSNAPFMAAHTHRASDGAPTQIGWVMAVDIDAEKVAATFRFAPTDLAEQWWKLASDPKGKGIAFSIGFIPMQYVDGTVAELRRRFSELRGVLAAAGLADGDKLRVWTKIEPLEISAVPVPSNRESIQLATLKAMGVNGETKDEVYDELATELAGRMIRAFTTSGKFVTPEQLSERIEAEMAEFKAGHTAQLDEILSMIPDDVNVDGLASGRASTATGDGDGDGGTKTEATDPVQATAKRLQRRGEKD